MSEGGDGVSSSINKCSLSKVLIFLFLVLLKAFSSIWSKIIMSMSSENEENEKDLFQKPLVITFSMFVSMSFALVMHVFVVYFRMSFPGYDHLNNTTIDSEFNGISNSSCDLVRSPSRIPAQAHNTDDTSISNIDSDSLPENTITPIFSRSRQWEQSKITPFNVLHHGHTIISRPRSHSLVDGR